MEFIFFVCMKDYTWYSISLFGKFNISGLLIVIPYYCFDFLLAVVLTRLLTIFRILMNVFREDVKINPLHHDNCGGLSILGNISQKLYIGTFLMGFVLVFGIYQNMILYDVSIFHFTNIILMFVYMLLSTLIFFLPLIATHRPMQKKKDEILNYISRYYAYLNEENIKIMNSRGYFDKQLMYNFKSINKIGRAVSKMSVFPFNIQNIVKFVTSMLLPILTMILQVVLSRYLG
ncbi:MAG: hypothetical protein PQJ50_10880 [Spirochaetales bacterium]|nr:hypothetical protein [Spirochaetales bacterium]